MQAIAKLRRSGLTTSQIAEALNVEPHTVWSYDRFGRFPTRRTYLCIVELAEVRGVTLLARDFLPAPDAAHCEPEEIRKK